ncbi:MAG: thioredoxin domain-containing protein [Plectolyngbya sp. WJT66-NPBG17]|jgi:protein-disulfide isomerase|nr:thioredoxin domain-containing protein [Plectolyngbya sp. WJT66-NPBG17]
MTHNRDYNFLFVPPSVRDHIQGVLNAAVVLVMYADYECFQSANMYRLIKAAQQQLRVSFRENDLCFIFRHFPQVQIHPHAQRAAEAAEAAATQSQFWQMHEMLDRFKFIPL